MKSPKHSIENGIAFLTEDRKKEGLVLSQEIKSNLILASMPKYTKGGFVNNTKMNADSEMNMQSLKIKAPSIKEPVGKLSGGNQQKVVVGKWLNTEAEIYIFDEPTRGIDVGAKVEIYNVINQLTDMDKCVIMISSELPEILGMSDRVIVMREGGIMAEIEMDSDHFNQEDIMKAAWGGKIYE
jgi:ribose transport system ATP-binding protein